MEERVGVGEKEGVMTQSLYVHTNKGNKKKEENKERSKKKIYSGF
jgi:hypothetical protein